MKQTFIVDPAILHIISHLILVFTILITPAKPKSAITGKRISEWERDCKASKLQQDTENNSMENGFFCSKSLWKNLRHISAGSHNSSLHPWTHQITDSLHPNISNYPGLSQDEESWNTSACTRCQLFLYSSSFPIRNLPHLLASLWNSWLHLRLTWDTAWCVRLAEISPCQTLLPQACWAKAGEGPALSAPSPNWGRLEGQPHLASHFLFLWANRSLTAILLNPNLLHSLY